MSVLSRFAFSKNQVTQERVRPKVFEPNILLQVSVFIVTDLSQDAICEIGKRVGTEIAQEQSRRVRLFGWAQFLLSVVMELGLRIERDNSCEYGQHANILGWPEDTEALMRLQVELAYEAKPVRIRTITCSP